MKYPLDSLSAMPIRQAAIVVLLDNHLENGEKDLPPAVVNQGESIYGDYESDCIVRHASLKLVEAANLSVYRIDCDICSISDNAPQDETYLFTRNGECVIARVSFPDYCDDESDGYLYALSTPLDEMAASEEVAKLIQSKIDILQGQIANCEQQLNKLKSTLQSKQVQPVSVAILED